MSPVDLSLPEAPRQRARGGWIPPLTLLVSLAVLALAVLARLEPPPGAPPAPAAEDVERLKVVAEDLEKETLYLEAATAWEEYAERVAASLDASARKDLLFRRARCLKEGGSYAAAARLLNEHNRLDIPKSEKKEARLLLLECLSALGKQEVRAHLARNFAIGSDEVSDAAVARVGGEAITRDELRAEIALAARDFLQASGAPLSPGELEARVSEVVDRQLADPEAAKEALLRLVSARVLHREGLERGLAGDEETALALDRFRRHYVGSRVVAEEEEKARSSLGPTEIKNHYEAHKEKFVEKASAEISLARFARREEAEAAIEKLRADPAADVGFEKAAGTAVQGAPLPGIGLAPELTAHVLALKAGETSDRPLEHEGAFYLVRAERASPERQLSFEEAEPRVRADLALLKSREAMAALQEALGRKYQVEILDDALRAAAARAAGETAGTAAGEGKGEAAGGGKDDGTGPDASTP
jgi:hypothetical protein